MYFCKNCNKIISEKIFYYNNGYCNQCFLLKHQKEVEEKEIKYMCYDTPKEYQSTYCYPGTEVLKNKLNIKDADRLEKMERRLASMRLSDLQENPILGDFDTKHLLKIHKYVFQDIYEFGGKFRVEEVSKGNTNFAPTPYLKEGVGELLNKLKKENYLKGLNSKETSKKLAYYMAELNFAHPFREGNGRTQREFIRELALKNGYRVEWNKVSKKDLLKATIEASKNFNLNSLSKLIENCFLNKSPDFNLCRIYSKNKDIDFDR